MYVDSLNGFNYFRQLRVGSKEEREIRMNGVSAFKYRIL